MSIAIVGLGWSGLTLSKFILEYLSNKIDNLVLNLYEQCRDLVTKTQHCTSLVSEKLLSLHDYKIVSRHLLTKFNVIEFSNLRGHKFYIRTFERLYVIDRRGVEVDLYEYITSKFSEIVRTRFNTQVLKVSTKGYVVTKSSLEKYDYVFICEGVNQKLTKLLYQVNNRRVNFQ